MRQQTLYFYGKVNELRRYNNYICMCTKLYIPERNEEKLNGKNIK